MSDASSDPRATAAVPKASPEEAVARFLHVVGREVGGVCRRTDCAAIVEAGGLIQEAEARGGRVHVTGVGKPEHIAHYAAALLSSTGTPATFLHATEATHGSVGQLQPGDVVIAISNSGETVELQACVDAVREFGASLIAVTAHSDSSLGRSADLVLETCVAEEGGPLGLAPRTSVLAQLVVLAGLSVELEAAKGFRREDYNRRHPAGVLGQRSAGKSTEPSGR